MKIFILPLAIIAVIQLTQSATLRRKPKVYNALITTDQNLTPSRAFPVIQSHLQETYSYPSYSYRSYAPAPLGLYNNGFQYGSPAASSIASYNRFHSYPRLNPGLVEGRNYFPRDDIPPIPLNYGLPPALVPINSFGFGNLSPYPYNSYPLIYDQFAGYGGGYLPPYPFYPTESDETNNLDKGNKDGENKNEDAEKANPGDEATGGSNGDSDSKPSVENDKSSGGDGSNGDGTSYTSSNTKSSKLRNSKKPEHLQQQSLNENIKNFPNKDPSIPDVPPPPPVGAKSVNK